MKKFFNAEVSLTIVAADAADLVSQAKAQNATIGKKPAQELWDGKRDNAGGFEFVEDVVEVEELEVEVIEPALAPVVEDAPAPVVAPTAWPKDLVAAAMANFTGTIVTQKPAPAPAPAKTTAAPKVVKAVAPKGKIKPVRKDTKIARGLEALLGGVTMEELLAVNVGDDLVDFVNRRVTKRGYGIALVEGKVKLVLPEGVVGIAYSG